MHIGIDARLPTYQMGGISQYVLNLLSALAEGRVAHDGIEYTVFQSRKEARSYRPAHPDFRQAALWTPCHHRWERWLLGLELLRHDLDVMHSPDFIPPAFGARHRLITVHDLNFLYYPQYLTAESRRYYVGQIEWAVRVADHIMADSEHTRLDLIRRLDVPPGKVTTVYLAAGPIYERPVAPEAVESTLRRYDLSPGFVLFVGTLEPRKNIPMLLRAFAALRQDGGLGVPLVLVGGKGWLYDDIFQTIEALGLQGVVRHLQGVPDADLACLYQAAGVLALPSHYEGFGLPLLEAMHCGCPVVASNRASLPEVVGEAGLLLDPDDVDAWVEGLATALLDRERREAMISAGYEQARRFTWEKTAAATRRLYRKVVCEGWSE
ncbi:MAG: glycosyltransferase family 1 protein [Candidatus Promineifilaceae bacterium]|nr:glycosyltransferase family 1 protein [Candidatus Promineifilaceae bacterium]